MRPPRDKQRRARHLTGKIERIGELRDRLAKEAREELEDWCLARHEEGMSEADLSALLSTFPEWAPIAISEVRFRIQDARSRRRVEGHIRHAKENPPDPIPF